MKIGFYGAAHEVTGSCTLLEIGNVKGIVDCGMEQGKDLYVNRKLPYDAHELDFVLLSMHQVDNLEFWTQDFQRGRSQKEYNELYYREIYNVQKVFKNYSVLAHLDLLSRYDELGVYPFENVRDMIAEILKLAIADGKGIELNTSSWKYGLKDTQPCRAILKLYKDLGGRILTAGSDAHTTRQLGDHLDEGYRILRDEIGFTEICTFDHMTPVFHQL